jgi:HK97 gp10 family phage protein
MSLTLNADRLVRAINAAVVQAVDVEARRMEEDARRMAPVRKVFSSKWLGKLSKTRRRRQIVGLSSTQLNAEAEIRNRLGLGPHTVNVAGSRVARLSVMREPNPYRQVIRRTLASEMLDESWYQSLSHQQRRSSKSGKQLAQLREADIRLVNEFGHLQKGVKSHLTARGRYELANARKRGTISRTDIAGRAVAEGGETRLGGRLRSEIAALPVTVEGSQVTGRVISPTPYAKYVEFGTHHAPAQPYMRPAANIARRRFRQTLQRTLSGVTRTTRRASR